MKYNKTNQPYEILGRFRIYEGVEQVEYCRIRFSRTGNVQIVKNELEKKGEFIDSTELANTPEVSETEVTVTPEVIPTEVAVVEEPEVVQDDITSIEPKTTIIAINKDGKEFTVEDLEAFVVEHKLDIDAVEAVLAGKQKTHRKWRFSRV